MYFDSRTFVKTDGYLSSSFYQSRGVRQDDPLSPILFILSIEIVRIYICSFNKFRHIPRPSTYCDGLTAVTS
eukprot:Awhi_evm1s9941